MDKEMQEIMDKNLSPEAHTKALVDLKMRQRQVITEKGHDVLRSPRGLKNHQISMKKRTYDVLKLIKRLRRSTTNGSLFDDLFSANQAIRDQALSFLNDFISKRLHSLFVYSENTRTWEIDMTGLDMEYFNKLDDYGYLDA